ncbi:hypothetical protein B9T07_24925 [Limnospira fusiformis CCALA 023]
MVRYAHLIFYQGVEVPLGDDFRHCSPISLLNVSHIAVTLYAIVKESLRFPILRFDFEFPALFCIFLYKTLGHINSCRDGHKRASYIQPRG